MDETRANGSPAEIDQPFLSDLFRRVRALSVWVVGDIMLDQYAIGDVARISPEAPVPVVRIRRFEERLGGAANVARQVAVLGARVTLAGLVGDDPAGRQVIKLCRDSSIDAGAIRSCASRQTSRKLRGLARHQQLIRLDFEDTAPCPADATRRILECLQQGCVPDVVILSDYAKGVLTHDCIDGLRELAAAAGARFVVDPKQRDFSVYRGASILTPNLHELELAAGKAFDPRDIAAIVASARSVALAAGADALVVTCGERGMLVVPAAGEAHSIAAHGPVLFDPTGAGDTVVAMLAAALTAGAPLAIAAVIANTAAGLAVARIGTVSITPDQVIEALSGATPRKVMTLDGLAARVDYWRSVGKRIVLTNGCFDLLHAGHLALLQQAAQQGDVLIVAINSDASIARLKGPERPLVSAPERAAMLAALGCVDAVTIFDEDTPLAVLQAIRPDVLVKGQDYRPEQVVGRELVETAGGRVLLVPLVPGKSTTALVNRIAIRNSAR